MLLNRILLILVCVTMAVSSMATGRSRRSLLDAHQLYVGGRLGVGVPLSMGAQAGDVSFKDVASVGFSCKIDGMWMLSNVIGLGGELGFNTFPFREQFWAGQSQRGSFDASYRDASLGVTGRTVLGSYDVKPYFGIAIDAHVLMNTLTFVSDFAGTVQDESVHYKKNQLKPGFAGEVGFFYNIGSRSVLSVAARLNVMPFLSKGTITTVDAETYQERRYIVNPHGNQNNVEVLVGLHFGCRGDRYVKKR